MEFSRRRWFTLWEILVIVVVISVGLMSIISLLTYGINFVQKSRQRVIALNLAREGIEAVYQIRDTNWQRWWWMKDACRLKVDPLLDENTPWCSDDTWMASGHYILQTTVMSGQQYFVLTWYTLDGLQLSGGITTGELNYSLCQSWGVRTSCPWVVSLTPEGRYFREVKWYGVFLKDVATTWGQFIVCPNGTDVQTCGSERAKEFRFCSKVVYVGYGTGQVELCGVITNFKGK